jgi:hypothetical protein
LLPAVELMTRPAVQAPAPPVTMAKSPGLALVGSMTAEASVRLAVPVLVSVTTWDALLTASISFPNASVGVGFRETMGAVPVPVSGRRCGLPAALSVILTVAVRAPTADGVNVAAMLQVLPAANVDVVRQSATPDPLGVTRVKSAKFPEVVSIATLVIVNGPVPEFVSTEADCALVVARNWLPSAIVVGARLTAGTVPVPVSVMTCVVGVALSVIVMVAERLPVAVGVNVAATLQLALAARLPTVRQSVPLEGVACAKSPGFVPPRSALEIFSVPLPVLVSVTNCCPLVTPVSRLPKAIVELFKLATGCVAVPLRATVSVPFEELVMESVADRLAPPVTTGLKITFTTQEPVVAGKLAFSVQLFVPSEKSPALVPLIDGAPVTVTAAPVGLLSVTGCAALEVLTAVAPKLMEVGFTLTFGFVPAPDKLITTEPVVGPAPTV